MHWPPNHLLTIAVALLALGLSGTVVPSAMAAPPLTAGASSDPLTALGGGSPSCRQDVGPVGRANCQATGSIAYPHPIGNYGLDSHVTVGITHIGDAFFAALQTVAGVMWMGLVYLIKAVLLLLEWGFSVDLLATAMSGVRRTLDVLHTNVLGQTWFLAALSVTALWGIWRGLIQRQTAQTITGLLATVALMVGALVIVARPDDTVGHASRLANDASLGVLAAATAQPLQKPARSIADASQGLFDSLVRDPWCALQFGSVTYCDQHITVPPAALCKLDLGQSQQCLSQRRQSATLTNGDAWLSAASGSDARDSMYHALKGDDSLFGVLAKLGIRKDPQRVALMEKDGTFSRFAILSLVAIGLLGAAALLAYFGIRLLLASLLALLLLLFAPAMLLAPAFGESGRRTFIAWAKRLVGAIAAKLIYALFLAVVLSAAAILRRLDIGWFGSWLLQIAFWWGVLIKRHELIGFLSVKTQPEGSHTGFLSHLAQGYYAVQMGRTIKAGTQRILHPPARAAHATADRVAGVREQRRARGAQDALAEFDAMGRRSLQADQQRATAASAERVQAERQLRIVDRRLSGYDEHHASAKAAGREAPPPSGDQVALLQQRRALLDRLASPDLRAAPQVLAHAERNRAQTGDPVTDRDLAAFRQRRIQDHAADLPVDHERHVRAAGLDPAALASAEPQARIAMLDQVSRHLAKERELLDALPTAPAVGRPELRVDPARARAQLAERRARSARHERFTRKPKTPSQ